MCSFKHSLYIRISKCFNDIYYFGRGEFIVSMHSVAVITLEVNIFILAAEHGRYKAVL